MSRNFRINECAYVGDTQDDFDAVSGSDMGMRNVSVCTGDITPHQFTVFGQNNTHVIMSIKDLPQWLDWYLDWGIATSFFL